VAENGLQGNALNGLSCWESDFVKRLASDEAIWIIRGSWVAIIG
jgi:hypothetical protein